MITFRVLRQNWLESELGWGTRPDGYSLHANEAGRLAFVEEYWARMPDKAPEEYSRPTGHPMWVEVEKEVYEKVKVSTNGVRFY